MDNRSHWNWHPWGRRLASRRLAAQRTLVAWLAVLPLLMRLISSQDVHAASPIESGLSTGQCAGTGSSSPRRVAGKATRRPTVHGHFTLRTAPQGATVVVNGVDLGKSPVKGQLVRSSTPLKVRVSLEGYLTEESEVGLEQLKQDVRLYFELTPVPPLDRCTEEQGTAWLQILPRTRLSFDSLDTLRLCFAKERNWPAVITVASLMLAQESRGPVYYDRAQAGYYAGGLDNYYQCVLDAESARRFGGLGRCQLWRTQHLRLVCLLNYENHLRRPRDRALDLPDQDELFKMLQDDLDNVDPGALADADRVCYDSVREKVKTMKAELKR